MLIWRIEYRKRIKRGEYKTTKKPIEREEAIDQILKNHGCLKDTDGSYYKEETETITPGESKLVGSYDLVLEDGGLKVVPTPESTKDGKGTITGLHIELQDGEEASEIIPVKIVLEGAPEE